MKAMVRVLHFNQGAWGSGRCFLVREYNWADGACILQRSPWLFCGIQFKEGWSDSRDQSGCCLTSRDICALGQCADYSSCVYLSLRGFLWLFLKKPLLHCMMGTLLLRMAPSCKAHVAPQGLCTSCSFCCNTISSDTCTVYFVPSLPSGLQSKLSLPVRPFLTTLLKIIAPASPNNSLSPFQL